MLERKPKQMVADMKDDAYHASNIDELETYIDCFIKLESLH